MADEESVILKCYKALSEGNPDEVAESSSVLTQIYSTTVSIAPLLSIARTSSSDYFVRSAVIGLLHIVQSCPDPIPSLFRPLLDLLFINITFEAKSSVIDVIAKVYTDSFLREALDMVQACDLSNANSVEGGLLLYDFLLSVSGESISIASCFFSLFKASAALGESILVTSVQTAIRFYSISDTDSESSEIFERFIYLLSNLPGSPHFMRLCVAIVEAIDTDLAILDKDALFKSVFPIISSSTLQTSVRNSAFSVMSAIFASADDFSESTLKEALQITYSYIGSIFSADDTFELSPAFAMETIASSISLSQEAMSAVFPIIIHDQESIQYSFSSTCFILYSMEGAMDFYSENLQEIVEFLEAQLQKESLCLREATMHSIASIAKCAQPDISNFQENLLETSLSCLCTSPSLELVAAFSSICTSFQSTDQILSQALDLLIAMLQQSQIDGQQIILSAIATVIKYSTSIPMLQPLVEYLRAIIFSGESSPLLGSAIYCYAHIFSKNIDLFKPHLAEFFDLLSPLVSNEDEFLSIEAINAISYLIQFCPEGLEYKVSELIPSLIKNCEKEKGVFVFGESQVSVADISLRVLCLAMHQFRSFYKPNIETVLRLIRVDSSFSAAIGSIFIIRALDEAEDPSEVLCLIAQTMIEVAENGTIEASGKAYEALSEVFEIENQRVFVEYGVQALKVANNAFLFQIEAFRQGERYTPEIHDQAQTLARVLIPYIAQSNYEELNISFSGFAQCMQSKSRMLRELSSEVLEDVKEMLPNFREL